jgi:hypothetical protein
MASWDLDFVKVDDLAGHYPEIAAIRKAIDKSGRPIVLSISPGGSTPARGAEIASLANQWRISGDFWDNWPALFAQFARMNDWTPYRAPGHWPDADMIPFGNVRAWGQTNAWTHFTQDEQRTLMSLWCIGRSPLILGANLPKNDAFTLSLLNNDDVIAVNQASTNNHQVFNLNNHAAWVADVPGSKDKYLALFNLSPAPPPGRGGRGRGRGPTTAPSAPVATVVPTAPNPAATQPAEVTVGLADLGLSGPCKVRDLWNRRDLPAVTDAISATIVSHGSVLYRITPG